MRPATVNSIPITIRNINVTIRNINDPLHNGISSGISYEGIIIVRVMLNIVPDDSLESWDGKKRFVFEDVDYPECLVISPSAHENYLNTQLLKLKLWADRNGIKLISYGCFNHFPFYSMFSHEVILREPHKEPSWYRGNSFNCVIRPTRQETEALGGKWFRDRKFKNKVESISDEDVINHDWKVFIRQSTVDVYEECKARGLIPNNCLVAEVKITAKRLRKFLANQGVIGADSALQKAILKIVGYNNYMGCQILASHRSNWAYLACGGVGNLFSVIPIKVIYFSEFNLRRPSASNIIRQLAVKRYGDIGKTFPLLRYWRLHSNADCEQDRVIEDLEINLDVIRNAVESFR